ncbi:MAG TPA: hypothetical protein VH834_09725, partial [Solirubrobacteraceae bacterium]
GLEDFMGAVKGEVWLTETGGIVGLRTRDGQVSLPRDELRARASVAYAFELARAFSNRVERMYLYQWQTDPDGRFDAGLVRADGSARPALAVIRAQLAALGGASAPVVAAAQTAVPGRVTITASRAGATRVRCTTGKRCVGRLWIEDARLDTVTLVNGRVPGDVLRPMWRSFALAHGKAARLRFTVPRSVLVRAWARRQLGLRLMLASPGDPLAAGARYRADAWRPKALSRRPRRAR